MLRPLAIPFITSVVAAACSGSNAPSHPRIEAGLGGFSGEPLGGAAVATAGLGGAGGSNALSAQDIAPQDDDAQPHRM